MPFDLFYIIYLITNVSQKCPREISFQHIYNGIKLLVSFYIICKHAGDTEFNYQYSQVLKRDMIWQ